MNPTPLLFNGKIVGIRIESSEVTAVFGNRFGTDEAFQTLFPEIKFAFLKQVHGRRVVEADPNLIPPHVADGHWTKTKNTAVGVYTADCIPLLLYDPISQIIAAVHAGWRGVASGIIPHASDVMKDRGSNPSEIMALLGPHIKKESFEVGLDVAEQLAGYSPEAKSFVAPHPDVEKKYFDLNSLARLQLLDRNINSSKIWSAPENTFTNKDFASYRREKGTGARQISFIFRT